VTLGPKMVDVEDSVKEQEIVDTVPKVCHLSWLSIFCLGWKTINQRDASLADRFSPHTKYKKSTEMSKFLCLVAHQNIVPYSKGWSKIQPRFSCIVSRIKDIEIAYNDLQKYHRIQIPQEEPQTTRNTMVS